MATNRCPILARAISLTLRAFRAVGRERDELIQEAWAALSGVALD